MSHAWVVLLSWTTQLIPNDHACYSLFTELILTIFSLLLQYEDKDAPKTLVGKVKAFLIKILNKVRRKSEAVDQKDEVSKKKD